jgi:transcriptional regulator with GAF, ATPase, and Fis domain
VSNNLVSVFRGNGFRQNTSMIRSRCSPRESMLQQTEPMESFLDKIVARRGGLRAILAQAQAVAPTNATVLITGETGTGKEVVARHRIRSRRDYARAGQPSMARKYPRAAKLHCTRGHPFD